MTTYRVAIFTEDNYHKYMCGYNNYDSEYIHIAANSKEEAIAIAQAKYPGYVINKYAIKDAETPSRNIVRKQRVKQLSQG